MNIQATVRAALFYTPIFTLLLFINLSLFNYTYDDAYIHFRIVENFLRHGQPYFNIGEPVMSSSSPGWTVVLYALFRVVGMNLKAVCVLNALVMTLSAYVYALIISALAGGGRVRNGLISLAVVLPVALDSCIGLMETPLALLLLGLGVLLFIRRRAAAFILLGAAPFFRYELTVFLILFAALNVLEGRVPIWKMCAFALAGTLPFLVYNQVYFGTNVPHTVAAKSVVYSLKLINVIDYGLADWLFPGEAGSIAEFALVGMLSYLVLRLSLDSYGRRADRSALLFFGGGVLIFLVYAARKTFIFPWYTPLYSIPVFVSAAVLAITRRHTVLAVVLTLALLPYAAGFAETLYASAADKSAYHGFNQNARVGKYLEVGDRLYRDYPGCSLMSSEIGGLGFAFKGVVYDAMGLVSPGALKYHPMNVPQERRSGLLGSIPPAYVSEVNPDIIVSYDFYMDALFKSKIIDNYIIMKEDRYSPRDMAVARIGPSATARDLNILIRKDRYAGGM